jgi:calcium release-activated calcium channel protein 1
MVEISLDDHKNSTTSTPLIITYSTLTCLVVSVHLLALMISTCILPLLEGNGLLGYEEHETIHIYIEFAWILSIGFGKKLCFFLSLKE